MIVLLSPAKTLDYTPSKISATAAPIFRKESKALIDVLRKHSNKDIQKLMKVSEKIATLNVDRYESYSTRFTKNNSKAALLAFDGGVYKGLNAAEFNATQMKFAQAHVRILSGLYGMLRPLDSLQAYRLEMGTHLKTTAGKNLYEFWGDKITKQINKDLKDAKLKWVINLASNEYFKSVKKDQLNGELITPNFKEYRGDDLKFIAFNAKKARGMMTNYIVKNKIKDLDGLKGFNYENYSFSEQHSSGNDLIFVR